MADRLLAALGVPKVWNTPNPFEWMEMISLQVCISSCYLLLMEIHRYIWSASPQGKTNFFEKRVGEYAKAGVGGSKAEAVFSTNEDF